MKFRKELLRGANFHGAKRITEGKASYLWAFALLMCMMWAGWIITTMIERYYIAPTYLGISGDIHEVREFPCVVVCPESKFPEYKINRFLEKISIPSNFNMTYIRENIKQLAAFFDTDVPFNTNVLEHLEKVVVYNNLTVERVVRDLTPSCEETVIRCLWRGNYVNCSTLFQMEITGDGFCCVFNGMSLRRQLLEGFYNIPLLNSSRLGPFHSLVLLVNDSQSHDNYDLSYKWLTIQFGGKYVDYTINGTALTPGFEHWFGYSAVGLSLSESASKLSPEMRKCRLHDKEPLKYFPVYDLRHCILECRMEFVYKKCGCFKPVHPLPAHLTYQYCKAKSLMCTRAAAVPQEFCKCLDTCDSNKDITTIHTFPMNTDVIAIPDFYRDLRYSRANGSVVRIFSRNHYKKTSSRKAYFSVLDLFAACGGILGLFFGSSILTTLEITMIVIRIFVDTSKPFDKVKHHKNTKKNFKRPVSLKAIFKKSFNSWATKQIGNLKALEHKRKSKKKKISTRSGFRPSVLFNSKHDFYSNFLPDNTNLKMSKKNINIIKRETWNTELGLNKRNHDHKI